MPACRAASSREDPSSTRASASMRRAARASRQRPASRRKSPAPSSRRVIATVLAPPPIGHTADQPRQAPRGSERDDGSAIRAVGMIKEEAMAGPRAPIRVNRAPVLTVWAVVVTERLGFERDEALTLGRALAGLTAHAKGV